MKLREKILLVFFLTCLFLITNNINKITLSFNEIHYTSPPTQPTYHLPLMIKNGGVNKSLILVHGHSASSEIFFQWKDSNLYGNYYNKVVAINYYWDGISPKPENYIGNDTAFTLNTNISDIIDGLFSYLNSSNFTNLDFLCHSLGGIVVRGLICNYYYNLTDKGIKIDDIITMGTPNQGSLIAAYYSKSHPFQILLDWLIYQRSYYSTEDHIISLLYVYFYHNFFKISSQLFQIRKNSPFIDNLKENGDETPHDPNITWTTVAGRISLDIFAYFKHIQTEVSIFEYDEWERAKNILFVNLLYQKFLWMDLGTDGLVSPYSVKLNGADNYVWGLESHEGLLNPGTARQNFIINILIN